MSIDAHTLPRESLRIKEDPITDGQVKFKIPLNAPLKEGQNYFWADSRTELIVIKSGQKIRAYPSICPHMGAQLFYNTKSQKLSCPWHELDFELASLKSSHHKYKKICSYEVKQSENELIVYERGQK